MIPLSQVGGDDKAIKMNGGLLTVIERESLLHVMEGLEQRLT